MKHSRLKGQNVALRKVKWYKFKWHKFDKLPGHKYEYIVILLSDAESDDCIMIDTDFRA